MSYARSKRYPELFRPGAGRVWWAFIPTKKGRKPRESTGHTDEQAAHLWYLKRIRSAGRADLAKEETTISDALKRRRNERRAAGRAPDTITFYEKKGRHLIRIFGGDRPLSSVDARAVDDYVTTRLREGAEEDQRGIRNTISKELVTLRGALKLARRQGYAAPAVEEVMPLDFSAKYKPKERALSELEIERLLAELEKKSAKRAAVVAFLLATGATYPSELANLRRSDIDMKAWIVRLRGTKRTTRDRKVPIVAFARGWLTRALPYAPFERWSNVRRDLHAACDAAGIARCSPNDLRRSVGTLLRAKGVEPSLIGTYLGHADGRMAERVYGRLAPEQLAHLLAERLEPKAPPKRRKKAA